MGKHSVVTTNYDTMLERIAASSLKMLGGSLYRVSLTNVYSRWGALFPCGGPEDTFTIHKLHGSVNWYHLGSTNQPIYYLPVSNRQPSEGLSSVSNLIGDLSPFIVPPIADKSLWSSHSGLVNRVWWDAYQDMKAAEGIYVIGYSFPETDISIRSMVGSACECRGKVVHVINLEFDDRLCERYMRAFVKCKIGNVFEGSTAVEDFVTSLGLSS